MVDRLLYIPKIHHTSKSLQRINIKIHLEINVEKCQFVLLINLFCTFFFKWVSWWRALLRSKLCSYILNGSKEGSHYCRGLHNPSTFFPPLKWILLILIEVMCLYPQKCFCLPLNKIVFISLKFVWSLSPQKMFFSLRNLCLNVWVVIYPSKNVYSLQKLSLCLSFFIFSVKQLNCSFTCST